MEEPVNLARDEHSDSRAESDSPAGVARLPLKLQVKSQNPMSKPLQAPRLAHALPVVSGNSASPKELPHGPPKAPSPTPPDRLARLRGGSPDVKAKELRRASPKFSNKSPPRAATPKSPVRSPKTPSFVPADVITPVFPATAADMAGALTSMATGLTYPYNMWGPVSKYGYLDEVEPMWAQKRHYKGEHDKLSKTRLQRRRFCFVRHPAYKELIEPEEKTCTSYLNPKRKEFWRTDAAVVLKREMKAEKDRCKRALEYMGNEEGFRRSELLRGRENRWKAFLDYDSNVKESPGFRNNQSGVKYDIITHKSTDPYEEKRVQAEKMKAEFRQVQRGLYIQARMSGARPFDILSWRKLPPLRKLPEWPEDIGPPPNRRPDDGMIPLNASKGALSFALPIGPFGTFASGLR